MMSVGNNTKKSSKKNNKVYKLIVILLILLGISAGSIFMYYKKASGPVDKDAKAEIIVDIPEGSSVKKIASILKLNGLISDKRVFVMNVENSDKSNKIRAGKYKLSQAMDNEQIIDKLTSGKIFQDGIKITIPEGSISTDIVNSLVKHNLGKRENYVKLFRNPREFSSKYKFLADKRIKTLEGFMYPETYFFKKGSTEKEIFDKMLYEFEKNYNAKVKSYVEKKKLNFYDTVIMASIVEKEAVNDTDRPIIAGVFYNRLDKKMRLQSDAALQYGLPKRKNRVLYKDLKVETPYNLYLNDGLPPTPICNPGIKSLIAAANPKKTDYLYFVTGTDGKNYFSKTFEEHKVHANKYRKELDSKNNKKSKKDSEDKTKKDSENKTK